MKLKEMKQKVFEGRGDAVKFSMLQFTFWFAIAVGSYQTVFMQSLGYSASTIGVINAFASVAGIFATPFWGMMSDKVRSLKKIVLFLYIMGSGAYLFLPASANITLLGMPALMILIPSMCIFRYPFFSLTDNWLVQSSHKKGLNYGPIRAVGSFSYAIGGILISLLIPHIGLKNVFYISAGLFVFVIAIGRYIDDVHAEKSKKRLTLKELNIGSLFKNYYFIIFLVFTFFLSIMTTCDINFLPFMLKAAGNSTTYFGMTTGFRALMELPLLLMFGKLRKKFPLHYLAIAAGILYSLGAILTGAFAQTIWHVILFSIMIGMGSGIWIACAANYIYTLATHQLKATAATIFSAISSVAGIVGNLVGGVLIDAIGAKHFYVWIGVMLLIAVAVYVALYQFAHRRGKVEFPAPEAA